MDWDWEFALSGEFDDSLDRELADEVCVSEDCEDEPSVRDDEGCVPDCVLRLDPVLAALLAVTPVLGDDAELASELVVAVKDCVFEFSALPVVVAGTEGTDELADGDIDSVCDPLSSVAELGDVTEAPFCAPGDPAPELEISDELVV